MKFYEIGQVLLNVQDFDAHFGRTYVPPGPLTAANPPLDPLDLCLDTNSIIFEEYGVEKSAADVLLEIRHFSQTFSPPSRARVESASGRETLSVHSKTNILLQRLYYVSSLAEPKSHQGSLSDSRRFAASLYLFMPFDNRFPDPSVATNSLLHKLKCAVSTVLFHLGSGNPLIAWLLLIEGVTNLQLSVFQNAIDLWDTWQQ